MALNVFLLNKLCNIIVGPFKDRQKNLYTVILVSSIYAANLRLVIHLSTFGTLTSANALYGYIEHFVFFKVLTTEPAATGGESFLLYELEEVLTRTDNLCASVFCVLDCSWWVDGGILVYCLIANASHLRKAKDNIGVLSA